TLNIIVTYAWIGKALRQVLPAMRAFGNVQVTIIVKDEQGNVLPIENISYTPETLACTFCKALYKNPLFACSVLTNGKLPPMSIDTIGNVVLIIEPYVVQFYNDDISDLCSNYTEVAAKVFQLVSTLHYSADLSISFSTSDPDCELQQQCYCEKM
ncbi:MAG: hypothetical protein ACRCWQ_09200, partial [Bacilli bacterium]